MMIGYVLHNKNATIQRHHFIRRYDTQNWIKYYRMIVGYVLHNKDFVIQKYCFISQKDVQKLILHDRIMIVLYIINILSCNE